MKKAFSFILIICITICVFSGCGSKGTKLTMENYQQYLKVGASCVSSRVSCSINPATENYDFNDVEIVIRAKGEYTIYNYIFMGYSSPGVPHYDATIPHSKATYDETFTVKLNIGGTPIDHSDTYVDFTLPSGTTVHGGSCDWEIVSISGTVTRVN